MIYCIWAALFMIINISNRMSSLAKLRKGQNKIHYSWFPYVCTFLWWCKQFVFYCYIMSLDNINRCYTYLFFIIYSLTTLQSHKYRRQNTWHSEGTFCMHEIKKNRKVREIKDKCLKFRDEVARHHWLKYFVLKRE